MQGRPRKDNLLFYAPLPMRIGQKESLPMQHKCKAIRLPHKPWQSPAELRKDRSVYRGPQPHASMRKFAELEAVGVNRHRDVLLESSLGLNSKQNETCTSEESTQMVCSIDDSRFTCPTQGSLVDRTRIRIETTQLDIAIIGSRTPVQYPTTSRAGAAKHTRLQVQPIAPLKGD